MTGLAIEAEHLTKAFKGTEALGGVDLSVRTSSVCALLGRNGAGKTTLLRILTTLLPADTGRAAVAGFDVARDPARVRARIGVTGQSATMDELLTGRQNLEIVGALFHLRRAEAQARAQEVLDRFGLADAADRLVRTYSGGMRRRIDLAASLVAAPPVLFLDEPTTGLDPISREQVWRAIRELVVESGSSVLLTTQYLDEADRLADTVVVIDAGRLVGSGAPSDLKRRVGQPRIRVVLRRHSPASGRVLDRLEAVDAVEEDGSIVVPAPEGFASLTDVVTRLQAFEDQIEDIALAQPSLDEVFTALTDREPLAADVPLPQEVVQ